jgi:hypothetical protein
MKKKLTLADLAQLTVALSTEEATIQEPQGAIWGEPLLPVVGLEAWIVVAPRAYEDEQGQQASATQPGFVTKDKFVERWVFGHMSRHWQKCGLLFPVCAAYKTEDEALHALEFAKPHVTIRENNGYKESDSWGSDGRGWMGNHWG